MKTFFLFLQAQAAAEETSPDLGNGEGSLAPWVGVLHTVGLFVTVVVWKWTRLELYMDNMTVYHFPHSI